MAWITDEMTVLRTVYLPHSVDEALRVAASRDNKLKSELIAKYVAAGLATRLDYEKTLSAAHKPNSPDASHIVEQAKADEVRRLELNAIVAEYISENLTLDVDWQTDYYDSDRKSYRITLCLAGKEIDRINFDN